MQSEKNKIFYGKFTFCRPFEQLAFGVLEISFTVILRLLFDSIKAVDLPFISCDTEKSSYNSKRKC